MPIIIRRAIVDDCLVLQKLNFLFNAVEVSLEYIKTCLTLENEIVFVAEVDYIVVGFIVARFHMSFCNEELSGEITELFVHEHYRTLGIASRLILECEKELKALNCDSVTIITNIKNIQAQTLYTKQGYLLKYYLIYKKGI